MANYLCLGLKILCLGGSLKSDKSLSTLQSLPLNVIGFKIVIIQSLKYKKKKSNKCESYLKKKEILKIY